ncbi:MAG: RNA-binding S4 domain-containing protein [Pseudohongiellaceae bacterium]
MTETPIPDGFSPIKLSREPVELFKVLKFESLVNSGGEAKLVIEQGLVFVNGEVETQKRKKIRSGDTIEFQDDKYFLIAAPTAAETIKPSSTAEKKKLPNVKRGAIPALSSGLKK